MRSQLPCYRSIMKSFVVFVFWGVPRRKAMAIVLSLT
jgi:hypothetical protein